jgi:RNA polymerase sigma factor (sigma-70 family)
MIIPSVGKQKIVYKDHSDVKFESLDFYMNLARKIIAKMGPTFFNGLSKEMLNNEDAISFVANAIMMGDWRWEEKGKKTNKSLYSYRNQCGIWAIKTYITKQYKNKNNKRKIKAKYSLCYQDSEDLDLQTIIADNNQKEPIDIIVANEEKKSLHNLIDKLFESDIISDKQKEYIRLYYFENFTLEKIGNKFDVTREAVRQSIRSALKKIRELI